MTDWKQQKRDRGQGHDSALVEELIAIAETALLPPIAGYTSQTDEAVRLVNVHKRAEEHLLRLLDNMKAGSPSPFDQRWLAIAQTHFEQGFMALNRAVFKPTRIKLPEDTNDPPPPRLPETSSPT